MGKLNVQANLPGRLRQPRPIKRARSAFSLEAVRTHGRLFYAYQNCIGNRTLKAAYLPAQLRWYNVVLWAVTFLPPIILIPLGFLDWPWAWSTPFIQVVVTSCLFVPIAKMCLLRGLSDDYAAVGVQGELTQQPLRLHGPLVRLMWFHDLVAKQENISHQQVKMSIELLELSAKDSPPSWTSYFRHPLPLLILGIVVFSLNARISQLVQKAADAEGILVMVGIVVAWLLGTGWVLYSWRYSEPQSRWSFLRTLRWLELSMRP
jgi:hypothetical protein